MMQTVWAGLMLLGFLSRVHGTDPRLNRMVIQIPLSGGERRCFAETIPVSETKYEFKAVEGSELNTESLEVIIKLPTGDEERKAVTTEGFQNSVGKGMFGDKYLVCFISNQDKKSQARIELSQESVPTREGPDIISTTYLQPVGRLIQDAKTVAENVVKEYEKSDELEDKRKERDEWLRDTINTLAALTMIVLTSVSGWQLVLLNKFFRSKKLI